MTPHISMRRALVYWVPTRLLEGHTPNTDRHYIRISIYVLCTSRIDSDKVTFLSCHPRSASPTASSSILFGSLPFPLRFRSFHRVFLSRLARTGAILIEPYFLSILSTEPPVTHVSAWRPNIWRRLFSEITHIRDTHARALPFRFSRYLESKELFIRVPLRNAYVTICFRYTQMCASHNPVGDPQATTGIQ